MLLHAADTLKQRITLALGSLAPCTALTLSALHQRADLAASALMASGDVDQCVDHPASTLHRNTVYLQTCKLCLLHGSYTFSITFERV
jgi:hypothetical protein